jgi:ABC-type nitrate/sulfonate/bicarbonate transport system substrate-binding protein
MTIITAQETAAAASRATTEAFYTICPVLVASNIATEFGWLDEEFKRVGARPTYLRSLADNAGWLPHYRHSLNPLFRDGGAIPTIWAKADLTDTTLIATTATQAGGQLLVRADADIYRVDDLRGKRIGLGRSSNPERIDFSRAASEFGIHLALRLGGLSEADVEIVDLAQPPDVPALQPAARPVELWSQLKAAHGHADPEVQALRDGRVDAIHSTLARTQKLVDSGDFKVILDLSAQPDWTLQVANGPYTNAVNTDFARQHPEVVVAFLRAAIRAGLWINAHRQAAAEIFPRVTFLPNAQVAARAIAQHDFVPALPAKNLKGLQIKKDFLRARGYVKNDFDVVRWADDSYLAEALRSLKED